MGDIHPGTPLREAYTRVNERFILLREAYTRVVRVNVSYCLSGTRGEG